MSVKKIATLFFVVLAPVLGVIFGLSSSAAHASDSYAESVMLAQAKQGAAAKMDESEMHSREGLSAFAEGDYEQAIGHFSEAIKLDPDNARALNNRGMSYVKAGKYDLAMADYTRALQLNPQFAEAYHNRAIASFRANDYARACSDLKRFRQLGGTPSPDFVKDLERSGSGKC